VKRRSGAARSERRRLLVALFVDNLHGGGAERMTLQLAEGLVRAGQRVDLLVGEAEGAYAGEVPSGLRLIVLGRAPLRGRLAALRADPGGWRPVLRAVVLPRRISRTVGCIPALAGYLRREEPDALIARLSYANLVALWARSLAGSRTRVVVTEANTLSRRTAGRKRPGRAWLRLLPELIRRSYVHAEAIVALADGGADDLAAVTGLARDRIETISNPVVSPRLEQQASEAVDHPWFAPQAPPVILGVGRLVPQKDFATLVRAFARVRAERPARLVILGEGEGREPLLALARELGVEKEMDLPGFQANPFAFMARCAVFVLSSAWEGMGNVLVEALAAGCPVVSTDCPHGPREVLDDRALGPLVPVGDDAALARAILRTLDAPGDPSLRQERAAEFSVERAVDGFLGLLAR
jgi:glycosyltransferase involved in cell wall biosynthesis